MSWDNHWNNSMQIFINFYPFKETYNINRLKSSYDYALRDIKRCEEAIEELKEYRAEIYKRVLEVQQMKFEKVIIFERKSNWYGDKHIYYYLSIVSNPCGVDIKHGKYDTLEKHDFEGRDRHLAIKKFKEYRTKYPFECVQKGINV